MARRRDSLWWGVIRRKLFRSSYNGSSNHNNRDGRSSNDNIIVLHTNNGRFSEDLNSTAAATTAGYQENVGSEFVSRDELAAITIQACFRGHLTAFRALKSLVKLQALVRGVVVRRQARIVLHCVRAMARLQITVRARQFLLNN